MSPVARHRLTPTQLQVPVPAMTLDATPPAALPPQPIQAQAFFDLIIIGSGPAALSLVARILESRPAALYTEDEHRHLHWLKTSRSPRSAPALRTRASGRGAERVVVGTAKLDDCECEGSMRILVTDRFGGWLANWDRLFKAYDITHLRSPLFFHPAPADLDALVAFAERKGCCPAPPAEDGPPRGRALRRERRNSALVESSTKHEDYSLIEIAGCVGKEVSKHKLKTKQRRASKVDADLVGSSESYARLLRTSGPAVNERERRDYHVASTKLFRDFVQHDVVERYGLEGEWPAAASIMKQEEDEVKSQDAQRAVTMVRGEVAQLNWGELHVEGWQRMEGFWLETADGARVGAKAVTCAMGPPGGPAVPPYLKRAKGPLCVGKGWAHAGALGDASYKFPPAHVKRGSGATLVVIGGGLTSAQICDLALRKGFDHVHLLLRGHMKVKPFDVGLEWMGRYANLAKMQFWQEDDAEKRLAMLRAARGGGSITPPWAAKIRALEAAGRITIRTHTEVSSATWDANLQRWQLGLTRNGGSGDAEHSELQAAFIVAATGVAPDFASLPFMRGFVAQHPIPFVGGLPVLSENLQWCEEVPLFCVGASSGLQIGPAAPNLGGMREAAERVASRLAQLSLGSLDNEESEEEEVEGGTAQPVNDFTHFGFNALSVEG